MHKHAALVAALFLTPALSVPALPAPALPASAQPAATQGEASADARLQALYAADHAWIIADRQRIEKALTAVVLLSLLVDLEVAHRRHAVRSNGPVRVPAAVTAQAHRGCTHPVPPFHWP